MLVPTIILLEFSDKNEKPYERLLRNFLTVHFLIIFFIVQSFKYEFFWKILDIKKYNIVRHWFSTKNWIFAIFFKKVSIDGFSHYLWGILYCPKFQISIFLKNPWYEKYNIVRHWFSIKIWIFAIFFKKVSWIFWSIFWLFFLLSKVSNMKFYEKSLIYNYSKLYDIDFPQKIRFLRFFLRKFLSTVFYIIYGKYYFFYCPKVQIWIFIKNPWYTIKFNIVRHWFSTKIRFLRFFLKKFLLTVFHIFHRKYTPNFQKIDFSIYPNILLFLIRILCSFQQ